MISGWTDRNLGGVHHNMRIVHRVGVHFDSEFVAVLDRLGIKYDASPPLITFDADETSPDWPQLSELIQTWKACDWKRLVFTRGEVESAEYLQMGVSAHMAYPQPERDWGYLAATYDLSLYCDNCGTGARQVNPFRIKAGIDWKSYRLRQLNWVFDEFFVPRSLYSKVFEPLGMGFYPVLQHRTGREIPEAVQLRIDALAGPITELATSPCCTCSVCGRVKLLPLQGTALGLPSTLPALPVFKTAEVFGDGLSAHRCIVVHRLVRERLEEHKVKGVHWEPLG